MHPDMLTILDGTTGFIKTDEGGQRLRDLYRAGESMLSTLQTPSTTCLMLGSVRQDPNMYRQFALECFLGQVAKIKRVSLHPCRPLFPNHCTPWSVKGEGLGSI